MAPSRIWFSLIGQGDAEVRSILLELRVPRTLLAILVGAALGIAGVVLQAATRNPLAEPGLLGVSAGASFAVVLAISMGEPRQHCTLASQ